MTTRTYTLNLGAGGDTVKTGITKLDAEVPIIYTAIDTAAATQTMDEQGTAPTTTANQAVIYAAEYSGATQIYMRGESNATVQRITTGSTCSKILGSVIDATTINTADLSGPLTITQNSDTLTLSCDGTNANVAWSDGELILQTAEGSGSDTVLRVQGNTVARGYIDLYDISATNRVRLGVASAVGANRLFELPSDAPADGQELIANGATGATKFEQLPKADNWWPNSAAYYWRSGATSAPSYWAGTYSSVAMTAAEKGRGSLVRLTNTSDAAAWIGLTWGSNGFTTTTCPVRVSATYSKNVVVFGWVKASTASRAGFALNDGVTTVVSSTLHTGGSAYEKLYSTMTFDAAATAISAWCWITSGASITVDFEFPRLDWGTAPTEWAPYQSKMRTYGQYKAYVASNAGDAITGCGFSPVRIEAHGQEGGAGNFMGGSARLSNATTTYATPFSTTYVWDDGVNDNAAVVSWDADGATISVNRGNNQNVMILFREGDIQ